MLAILGVMAMALVGMSLVPSSNTADDDDGRDPDQERDQRTSVIEEGEGFLHIPEGDETDETETGAGPGPGAEPGETPQTPPVPQLWDEVQTGTEEGEWIAGGEGRDLIAGLGGADHLTGGGGADSLYGGAGGDSLLGGDGDDALDGGEDDDDLFGEMGDDWLAGGGGDDRLTGGDGADSLDGGEGDDSLLGSGGDDVLDGGAGADVLGGGDGDDVLIGLGDATRDYLNGAAGDDVLRGGAGDNLNGGEGADLFEVGGEAGGPAVVDDFNAAEDALVVVYDGTGPEPELTQRADESGVVLMADGVEVAQVLGVDEIDLAAIRLVAA
jgi:Ca2+-binding RTX toxin-like protein